MVGNPQRFVVEITAKPVPGGITPGPWNFRLGLTGVGKLQKMLSTPDHLWTIPEVFDLVAQIAKGDGAYMLDDLMLVLLAGFQEFHANTIKTTGDVEDVIAACGGVAELTKQLEAMIDAITADPEDQKRREEAEQERKLDPLVAQTILSN